MLPHRDLIMYDALRLKRVQTFRHGHERASPAHKSQTRSDILPTHSNTLVQHVYPFHTFKHSLKRRVVKRVGQHV